MRSKVCNTRSDLPITTNKKEWRRASRASFSTQDTTKGITPEVEGIMDIIRSIQVEIPHASEVGDYLLAHRDLSCLLPPICSKLREMFKGDAKLSLEVYRDPEIHDEYLTLYVRQKEYEAGILDRIDEAMVEFEPMQASVSGWLLVTTDFRPPR